MVDIRKLSIDIKIGQMVMCGFPSKSYDDHIDEIIKNKNVGNVILFTRNIGNKEEVKKLTTNLQQKLVKHNGIPGFISIDQEGGMVTRLAEEVTAFPGNMAFGAANEAGSTFRQGKIEGEELRILGINMNLAPVMDVNCNPKNPVIGCRSYGDDPEKVSQLGIDLIKGLKESNVLAVAKHFPGHGDTDVDSHLSLPVVNHDMERLQNIELLPFKKAINAGVDAIMSAHVLFPAIESEKKPGTLSYNVLTSLLKKELGFNGIVVTDCMEMKAIADFYGSDKAAVMAIKAGADLLCISHTKEVQEKCIDAIKTAVLNGEIAEERIDESVIKIIEIKNKYSVNKYDRKGRFDSVNTLYKKGYELADRISRKSITILKDEKKLLPVKGKVKSISTEALALNIADDQIKMRNSFCEMLREKFGGDAFLIPLKPSKELIDEIAGSCKGADTVIVGVYNAEANSEQIELVKKIQEVTDKIIVVSMRSPYYYVHFNEVSTYINVYEYTELSVKNVIKVISGEIEASGISPVKLTE
ncbi:beta-N-acetylhexosaminidase [Clostridium oryzae]|uniref:Beta-hexosaminidase n=1 Tax=Clostridium oryzae TaxID=1450648 RepID=A0A1V4ILT6_9CLOT|nr:beta-N-acetylhexosaminidase [Clostridium oryzae]OPJ60780.1 beta-hexosaminidase precursor [Clostridium oryzae]